MADIRDIAAQYIAQGWAVVPLVQGEKRAASSWQKKVYKPTDFGLTDGIAGKCGEVSGWRVDIDLDSAEAVAAAKHLLPATGLIHGRPGKPDSHYWFTCDGAKTTQFTDIKDAAGKTGMLVEIRSSGGYTALPPSGHPSGDTLAWVQARDPMRIEWDALYEAVRDVAIVSILSRHWPGHGATHAMIGPLCGFLLHAKVDAAQVQRIIKCAAVIAGDKDVADRLKYAAATCGKFAAGEPVTGGPKLAEILPDEVVARMRGWLKMKDQGALDEMNARHFVVRMGKDAVIGREDDDFVVFQQPKALYIEYANKKMQVGVDAKTGAPMLKPLFQEWLEAPTRRSFRKVVFAPPPVVCAPDDYNLWKGFAIEPHEGDCSRFLEHLHEIICSGDDEHYQYLLKLCAFTMQCPGIPSEVAMVMRGELGTGKGTFMRALEAIFGRHFIQLDKVDQLVGRFNSAISAKCVVFADEAFWAGDKRELGALKRIITEPTLAVEHKNIDIVNEKNCVHLFMATNEEWSVPAGMKERRFYALNVSNKKMRNTAYFNAIHTELKNGGAAAFLHQMIALPVTASDIRAVPMTKELRIQQNLTLAPEFRWWHEVLFDGAIGPHQWTAWCSCAELFDQYRKYCTDNGIRRTLDRFEFGRRMLPYLTADPKTHVKSLSGAKVRAYALRPLAEARGYFDLKQGTQGDWPDDGVLPIQPTIF